MGMGRAYDLTLPLRADLPTYPGEPGPRTEPLARLDRGDPANVSALSLGLHTGTHVDAPIHFLPEGVGVDALPLESLAGPAAVIEIDDVPLIGARELAAAHAHSTPPRRLLLKTRNSAFWDNHPTAFRTDYTALALDGAEWLVAQGVCLVGIDYLSIEAYEAAGHPVHRRLLGAGVVIVEGLDLRQVSAGAYWLVCLPLLVPGADGAPARVLLFESESRVVSSE